MGKRKENRTVEVVTCDICEKELDKCDGCFVCDGCGKNICHECKEKGHGVYYKPDVNYLSGLQGFFCNECDINPPDHVKEKHKIYREIQQIEKDVEEVMGRFAERADEAQIKLQRCFNHVFYSVETGKPVSFPRETRINWLRSVFLRKRQR